MELRVFSLAVKAAWFSHISGSYLFTTYSLEKPTSRHTGLQISVKKSFSFFWIVTMSKMEGIDCYHEKVDRNLGDVIQKWLKRLSEGSGWDADMFITNTIYIIIVFDT